MNQQLSGVVDITFDSPAGPTLGPSAALPALGEEDEPGTDDSGSDLLSSLDLSRPNPNDTAAPVSGGASILPPSLTSSTRHARTKSLGPALSTPGRLTAAALAAVDGRGGAVETQERKVSGAANLLGMSTASYKDRRDSPAKPRVVSLQAERFGGVAAVAGGGPSTPGKARIAQGHLSKVAGSPDSLLESTPETSGSLNLAHRWTSDELAQADMSVVQPGDGQRQRN